MKAMVRPKLPAHDQVLRAAVPARETRPLGSRVRSVLVGIVLGLVTPLLAAGSAQAGTGQISGHVGDGSNASLANICVSANAANPGGAFGFAQTNAGGDYNIGGLASGDYKVQFGSCGGSSTYLPQWYNGKST